MIVLFFLQKRFGGGTTTYTAHLARGFHRIGQDVTIVHIADRVQRDTGFGLYPMSLAYRHLKHAVKLARNHPSLIVAPTSPANLPEGGMRKLISVGAVPVLHDLTQRHLYPKRHRRFICIRESMVPYGGHYIPHPYERQSAPRVTEPDYAWLKRPTRAISTARVHNTKRTAMILKANELLPKRLWIKVMGAEYRLYSYGLAKRYASFQQGKGALHWPLTFDAPVDICIKAHFNVDLTKFPEDGGGTQYTQLEAMDAGCINVMHSDWFTRGGEVKPNKHVIPVASPEELADVIREGVSDKHLEMRVQCAKLLERHDASKIAKEYKRVLECW